MSLEKIINGAILKKIGPVSERTKSCEWVGQAGTSQEWAEWNKKAKSECPVLFAVGEAWDWFTGWRDHIWRLLYKEPKWYLRNRFIDRTHLIDTGLPKGKWQEPNQKLLHGVMKLAEEHMMRNDGDNPAMKLIDLWVHGKEAKDYVGECEEETKYFVQAMKDITPLVTAVLWFRNDYPQYEKTIDALYESVPLPKEGEDRWEVKDAAKVIYERIRKEEERQVVEIKKHLAMVVGCYDQIWD